MADPPAPSRLDVVDELTGEAVEVVPGIGYERGSRRQGPVSLSHLECGRHRAGNSSVIWAPDGSGRVGYGRVYSEQPTGAPTHPQAAPSRPFHTGLSTARHVTDGSLSARGP